MLTRDIQPAVCESGLFCARKSKVVLVGVAHQHGVVRLILLGKHANIVLDVQNGTVGLVLDGLEVQKQVGLDRADCVGLQPGVVVGVQLSRHSDIVVVGHHHVDVGGAIGMSAHDFQQVSRRSGGVDGIFGGFQAVEPEFALFISSEFASKVVTGLVFGVEDVVLAVGAGLPHVEDDVWNPLAGLGVSDHTMEQCQFAVLGHVLDDTVTEFSEWRLG